MNQHCAIRVALVAAAFASGALAQQGALPPLKKQASPEAVLKEHMTALNACDWKRMMAQFPADVEFFSPDGSVAKGRQAVGEMFAQALKPYREGGICGLIFTAEHTQKVGDTLNVQWRADAPFLASPTAAPTPMRPRTG